MVALEKRGIWRTGEPRISKDVTLDLTEGSRRNVRTVTLWLTPDPTPAPKPLPAPLPAQLAVPAPVPVAAPVRLPTPVPPPVPPPERVRPARVINVPSSGLTCPQPQFSQEQITSCAAMDYKNSLLSAQIVELEDKVKRLQVVIGDKVEAPAPAMVKPSVALAPPKPAPKAVPKEEGGFPWLLVLGIFLVLALIGAGVWFVLSRRKGKTVETAAADSVAWYARLAGRFRRKSTIVTVVDEVKDD